MKQILFLVVVLVCSSFAIAGPLDYSSGLISYWKADGNATDSVGSNHGTFASGTYVADQFGGQAFDLDGINDYVEIADDDSLSFGDSSNDSPYTFSAWIKADDATHFPILTKGSTLSSLSDFEYYFQGGDGSDTARMSNYDASSDAWQGRQAGAGNMTQYENKWTFIVATYAGNSLNSGHKFYINGQRVDVFDFNHGSGTYVAMENDLGKAHIGYLPYNGRYSNGSIDEVAIWNRTLNDSEILGLYNSYGQEGVIPEVSSKALQIFVVLIVALLIGALLLRKK